MRPHLSLPFACCLEPSCSASASLGEFLGLALGVTYSGRGHPRPTLPLELCAPTRQAGIPGCIPARLLFPATLPELAGAAVTECHSPRGCNSGNLLSRILEAGSLRSRCSHWTGANGQGLPPTQENCPGLASSPGPEVAVPLPCARGIQVS